MTTYDRSPNFGYGVLPATATPARSLALAALCESFGLNYLSIQQPSNGRISYDNWTLLTAIGTSTSRIFLVANASDMPSYSPPMLAKAVATLDLLTNGRVELVLDIASFRDILAALEGQSHHAQGGLKMVEDALQTLRALWSDKSSDNSPIPAHQVTIWLSALEPTMISLVGRYGDGWLINQNRDLSRSEIAMLNSQVDQAATEAGRTPAAIKRIYNVSGTINTSESNLPFRGTTEQWAMQLTELATETGIDTFMLMEGEDAEAQLELFATEVMPRVTELVATAPGVTITSGLARAHQGAMASGLTPAEEVTDDVDWVDETSMESFPASDPPASSSFT